MLYSLQPQQIIFKLYYTLICLLQYRTRVHKGPIPTAPLGLYITNNCLKLTTHNVENFLHNYKRKSVNAPAIFSL